MLDEILMGLGVSGVSEKRLESIEAHLAEWYESPVTLIDVYCDDQYGYFLQAVDRIIHLHLDGWEYDPEYLKLQPKRKRQIIEIIKRDGFACAICGERLPDFGLSKSYIHKEYGEDRVHIDHIFPKARGGGDNIENLQLAHGGCNIGKNSRLGYVHKSKRNRNVLTN